MHKWCVIYQFNKNYYEFLITGGKKFSGLTASL